MQVGAHRGRWQRGVGGRHPGTNLCLGQHGTVFEIVGLGIAGSKSRQPPSPKSSPDNSCVYPSAVGGGPGDLGRWSDYHLRTSSEVHHALQGLESPVVSAPQAHWSGRRRLDGRPRSRPRTAPRSATSQTARRVAEGLADGVLTELRRPSEHSGPGSRAIWSSGNGSPRATTVAATEADR